MASFNKQAKQAFAKSGNFFPGGRLVFDQADLVSESLLANHSLTANESGNTIFVDTSGAAVTLTLPATALGVTYNIKVSKTGNALNISPNASDLIRGLDAAGVDDKDIIFASPVVGDFIKLFGDGSVGWYVQEASGTITREA